MNYEELGDWEESERWYKKTMYDTIAICGENHPGTLSSMSSLANNWIRQGQHNNGKDMLRIVLERRKAVFGEDHSMTKETAATLSEWEKLPKDLDRSTYNAWVELNEIARRKGYKI